MLQEFWIINQKCLVWLCVDLTAVKYRQLYLTMLVHISQNVRSTNHNFFQKSYNKVCTVLQTSIITEIPSLQ